MDKSGKTAVLCGGYSAERAVSLQSGAAALAALHAAGVVAETFDPSQRPLADLVSEGYTRVFIALHGRGGEDGSLQGALDWLRLPYTGSGVLASALAMDKWRCKQLWQGAGLPVPAARLLTATSDFSAVAQALGLPLFVKPACEGSSIGVSKVHSVEELAAAYACAARYDAIVLAERYLGGGEYTVGIVDGQLLPAIRIVPAGEYYDYDAKYLRDDTQYRIPCGLPVAQEARMQELALAAAEALGYRGWIRIDFVCDNENTPYLLEANTVPGMTTHSLIPMAARAAGIPFSDLVMRILAGATHGDVHG